MPETPVLPERIVRVIGRPNAIWHYAVFRGTNNKIVTTACGRALSARNPKEWAASLPFTELRWCGGCFAGHDERRLLN